MEHFDLRYRQDYLTERHRKVLHCRVGWIGFRPCVPECYYHRGHKALVEEERDGLNIGVLR